MNFPTWVEDGTAIPPAALVRAKRALYVFAACEKLRLLKNAGWKWVRGDTLTSQEEGLLSAQFPGQWPTAPTEQQFQDTVDNWWEPRQQAAQALIIPHRRGVLAGEIAWVDLDGLI